jgi:hypothetical protein
MSERQIPFPTWFKVREHNIPPTLAVVLGKLHQRLRMMCEKISETVKPIRANYFNRLLGEYSKLLVCLVHATAQTFPIEQLHESFSIVMEKMFDDLKYLKQLILGIYRSKTNKCHFWTDKCVMDTYAGLVNNIIDMHTRLSNFKPIGSVGIE